VAGEVEHEEHDMSDTRIGNVVIVDGGEVHWAHEFGEHCECPSCDRHAWHDRARRELAAMVADGNTEDDEAEEAIAWEAWSAIVHDQLVIERRGGWKFGPVSYWSL
jgi:hypothetical protein